MTTTERLTSIYVAERERLQHIASCDGIFDRPVFGKGSVDSSIVIIGEAPGAQEVEQATPFVGKAGKTLDELLTSADIKRDSVFITNAVKYRPIKCRVTKSGRESVSNRTPSKKELSAALPCLRDELYAILPRVVITLGNSPLWSVFSAFGKAPAVIGTAHGIAHEIVTDKLNLQVYPLYHPASLIYNIALTEVMNSDMSRLKVLLKEWRL